jgi:hypothetical protein
VLEAAGIWPALNELIPIEEKKLERLETIDPQRCGMCERFGHCGATDEARNDGPAADRTRGRVRGRGWVRIEHCEDDPRVVDGDPGSAALWIEGHHYLSIPRRQANGRECRGACDELIAVARDPQQQWRRRPTAR